MARKPYGNTKRNGPGANPGAKPPFKPKIDQPIKRTTRTPA